MANLCKWPSMVLFNPNDATVRSMTKSINQLLDYLEIDIINELHF